jgi:hypothetical protein
VGPLGAAIGSVDDRHRIAHHCVGGTARAGRSSNSAMRRFLCGVILLGSVGCSSSHHTAPATPTTITSTIVHSRFKHDLPVGTITGRYYSDGGPPPPHPVIVPPSHPIIGTITVANVESHETYRPREDARGYFSLVVPVGTYGVTAEPRGGLAPTMTDTVTVMQGKTVDADLGIHFP